MFNDWCTSCGFHYELTKTKTEIDVKVDRPRASDRFWTVLAGSALALTSAMIFVAYLWINGDAKTPDRYAPITGPLTESELALRVEESAAEFAAMLQIPYSGDDLWSDDRDRDVDDDGDGRYVGGFVVVGFLRNESGAISGAVLAQKEAGQLHYAGIVSTGLSRDDQEKLNLLKSRERPAVDSPLDDAVWVEPKACTVEYSRIDDQGTVQDPVFKGWRWNAFHRGPDFLHSQRKSNPTLSFHASWYGASRKTSNVARWIEFPQANADNVHKRYVGIIGGRAMEISISDIRDHLADALNRVAYGSERVILTRRRKGVAALVSMDDLALLEALEDESDIKAARKALKEKGGITLEAYKKKHGLWAAMFTIIIKPSAEKQLDRLPDKIRARVLAALQVLAVDPRPAGAIKMTGELDLWRIRVGQYRVVYQIAEDRLVVLVARVGHRKDIYRGM
jgi:mRNA interferase RelE/StbE